MTKHLLISLLALIPCFCLAQIRLSGFVYDELSQPMPFANVKLINRADSTFVLGTLTKEDGGFCIETSRTDVLLKVSMVGYVVKYVDIHEGIMAPVVMTPDNTFLDEVVITGYKKLFEQKGGELVANVKGTFLEQFPKVHDVIAQIPFVEVQDGDISILGKGSPIIYINNRLVRDQEELSRLMTSDIKCIKVNLMPGAKYDATTNAVIQIITVKPQGEGLGGTLYFSGKRAHKFSTEEYISLNYRKKAFDFFASAYGVQNHQKVEMESQQVLSVPDGIHTIQYNEFERIKAKSLSTVVGANYCPNDKCSAGFQYIFNDSGWKNLMSDEMTHEVDDIKEVIQQMSDFDKPNSSHNVNAYYSGAAWKKTNLDVNVDWLSGDEMDRMVSVFPNGYSDDVTSLASRKYKYFDVRNVFTYCNNLITLDAGAEYSYTDMTQTYDISKTELGIDNTNDVTRQNRWAFFLSSRLCIGKWGLGAGLRYEDIYLDYYKYNKIEKDLSKSYHKLFPNFTLSYSAKNVSLTVGYERKIKYPAYSLLRSNLQYSSPYLYEGGNPYLQPQILNEFTTMITYRDLKAVFGYSVYESYIYTIPEIYENKPILILTPCNRDGVKRNRAVLNYTHRFKFWQPNIDLGVQWQYFKYQGVILNTPILSWHMRNTFFIPHQWLLHLDANWNSKGDSDLYSYKSYWCLNASISKQMFAGKMLVALDVNDIFRTRKNERLVDCNDIRLNYARYSDSRYIQLTIRYNFNTTSNKYKGGVGSDERQRL